jgi:hypothetical protein
MIALLTVGFDVKNGPALGKLVTQCIHLFNELTLKILGSKRTSVDCALLALTWWAAWNRAELSPLAREY